MADKKGIDLVIECLCEALGTIRNIANGNESAEDAKWLCKEAITELDRKLGDLLNPPTKKTDEVN